MGVVERLDDLRVEHGAADGHFAHRPCQLVAFTDPVFEQVGVPGRTLASRPIAYSGSSYCERITTPGSGMALADFDGGVDAFPLEVGGHTDVGHDTCGWAASAPVTNSS